MLVCARAAYEAVLDHARREVPREACGLLAGRRTGDRATVETAHPAHNAADTPTVAYRIDPRAQLALLDGIEAAGRAVAALYHSHPAGPPAPSQRDVETATWTGYHHVVVSLAGGWPTVDAWVWTGERFVRDTVVVRERGRLEGPADA